MFISKIPLLKIRVFDLYYTIDQKITLPIEKCDNNELSSFANNIWNRSLKNKKINCLYY